MISINIWYNLNKRFANPNNFEFDLSYVPPISINQFNI